MRLRGLKEMVDTVAAGPRVVEEEEGRFVEENDAVTDGRREEKVDEEAAVVADWVTIWARPDAPIPAAVDNNV